MEMAAHDKDEAKRNGIPQSVAEEFVAADENDKHYKKRENVAAKAADMGMSVEIYKALYGDR
jgi:hypothetical protein